MKARYTHRQTTPDGRVVQHDYRHSAPLFISQRIANYDRQNATRHGLTVRQARAVRKAERRAAHR